jgi:dipeptidyl-peptidase-4
VAFVRANNLHVVDIATQRERALTTDGNRETLNGKLDWLYQEEIYGRGFFRGYWWSPDSSRLAFLQLDERPVPEYVVVDTIPYRPTPEVTDYPKAGDPNPQVRLGIAAVSGAPIQWTDASQYANVDHLIVDVSWSPDAANVVYQVQDREQTWLDLYFADAASGRARRVLRETTKAWVNVNGSPTWLRDGSFLWLSERSGFKHLYQYRTDGTPVRPVTTGNWDVVTLYGVDEANGLVYYAANERSAIGTDLYRSSLTGSAPTRLSQPAGVHRGIFDPTFTQYVGVWSDATTPPQVRLHRNDGGEVRVIDANAVAALAQFRMSPPEFVTVPTRDGGTMDAMIIKPPDMVPGRRYPVFQHTYAGMGVPQARNSWGGSAYMFHQLLAQNGVVVWILDNRSASSKGVEAQWAVYGRLGELELRDLEDGVDWLARQPYVDASRIVLSGWSYGGFMTAYALTNSSRWAGGIAGGSVTDWRNYDTVWTERYMKTPQNNPDGYRRTAPRYAADRLTGKLLLIHGAIDDNVHAQNTEQMVYELQRAGKPFELMMYPRQRHGVTDPRLNKHLRQLMFDFTMRTVAAAPPTGATASQ